MKTLLAIFRGDQGQDLIEYALLMALLSIVAVGGVAVAHAGHLGLPIPGHIHMHAAVR
jgi:Flp pilus assembly pilin Flp